MPAPPEKRFGARVTVQPFQGYGPQKQAAIDLASHDWVLLLDADSGPGFVREWQPPGLPPERHIGYAVQWWAFALLLVGLFVGLNVKRKDG